MINFTDSAIFTLCFIGLEFLNWEYPFS